MERNHVEHDAGLIELGSLSADTHGDGGFYWEIGGLQPHPGLCAD